MPRTVVGLIVFCAVWAVAGWDAAYGRPTPAPWQQQSPTQLREATYEVFARHGRPFGDPEWQRHYQSVSWYKPDPGYSDERLTDAERLLLRHTLRRRLALSRDGQSVDRPLWQTEIAALDKPLPLAYSPALWPAGLSLACVLLFIAVRKARIPAMIGFAVAAYFIVRQVGHVEQAKSDAELDTAFLVRGPITAIEPKLNTQLLTIGGRTYRYKGSFPFRVGEIATLAASASGQVLVANGRRVLPESVGMAVSQP